MKTLWASPKKSIQRKKYLDLINQLNNDPVYFQYDQCKNLP